jgi:hypothetical protein
MLSRTTRQLARKLFNPVPSRAFGAKDHGHAKDEHHGTPSR